MKTKIIIGAILLLIGSYIAWDLGTATAQTGSNVKWNIDYGLGGRRYSIQFAIDTAQTIILPNLDISEFDGQLLYYGIKMTSTYSGSSDSVVTVVRGVHNFLNYATGTTTTVYDTLTTNLLTNKATWFTDTLNTNTASLWRNTSPYISIQFFGRIIASGTVYFDVYSKAVDALPPKFYNETYH